jgi:hypothetical protein
MKSKNNNLKTTTQSKLIQNNLDLNKNNHYYVITVLNYRVIFLFQFFIF